MRFSDERISSIAHLVHVGLATTRGVEYSDKDKAHHEIKKTLIEYFKKEDQADEAARQKITTLKRNVAEGSREWEILYHKYFEEELAKMGH